MGRKMIEVKTLYGLCINDLIEIANNAQSSYTRGVAQTVVMRYQGLHNSVIQTTLGKCRATVISYLNDWNEKGPEVLIDNRGNNIPSSLTEEMIDDIRDTVMNSLPSNHDYEQNRWNCLLLTRYIEDKYGKKYSDTWIRKLLKSLDFTYKRGVFKPTLADEKLQENFKKNGYFTGYN